MPLFIGALLGGLIQIAGTLVGKVLISLGIGFVVFSGIDTSLGWMKSEIVNYVGQAGSQALAAASALRLGTCISILTSALSARLVLNGLTGGTLKKMIYH